MAANAAPRGPRGGLEVQCDSEENREQMEDREADEEGVDGCYEGTFFILQAFTDFWQRGWQPVLSVSGNIPHTKIISGQEATRSDMWD